jgi:phosphohistidine phosphatase
MAAQLWLLRHGDAEARAADDASRRLTERGEAEARAAGRAFAALGLELDAVYASPKARALATAQLACEPLGIEPVVHEPLREGFTARDARELLAMSPGEPRVLAVGHNPDLAQVVFDMTGARIDLGKGSVAAVGDGVLVALLRAHELERLGA